jgi:predicted CoA-binding protein
MLLDSNTNEILKSAKTIAVVGASPRSERDSNSVTRYLIEQGYHVVPVNPQHESILGVNSYPDLLTARESEGTIDIVDIFRAPEHVMPHVEEAIQIQARLIWMQLGVTNDEAAQRGRAQGIPVVMNECLKIRHLQLKRRGKL